MTQSAQIPQKWHGPKINVMMKTIVNMKTILHENLSF